MTLRFCFPWILFRVLVSASPVVDRASSAKTLATGKRAEDFSSKLEARNLPQCYGAYAPWWEPAPVWSQTITSPDGQVEFDLSHLNNATLDSAIIIPQYKFAYGRVADASLAVIYNDLDLHCREGGTLSSIESNDNTLSTLNALGNATYDFLTSTDPNVSPLPKDNFSVELRRTLLSSPDSRRQLLWNDKSIKIFITTIGIGSLGALGYTIGSQLYKWSGHESFNALDIATTYCIISGLLLAGLITYSVQMRGAWTAPVAARVTILAEVMRQMLAYIRQLASSATSAGARVGSQTREALENALDTIRSGNWRGVSPPTPPEFRTAAEIAALAREGPNAC